MQELHSVTAKQGRGCCAKKARHGRGCCVEEHCMVHLQRNMLRSCMSPGLPPVMSSHVMSCYNHSIKCVELRFRREMGKDATYAQMSLADKESFRLEWAKRKYSDITKSKRETSERSDEKGSVRKYLSEKQLVKYYGSRKSARNHMDYCLSRQEPGWVEENVMAGVTQYLVIEVSEKHKAKQAWQISEEARVEDLDPLFAVCGDRSVSAAYAGVRVMSSCHVAMQSRVQAPPSSCLFSRAFSLLSH